MNGAASVVSAAPVALTGRIKVVCSYCGDTYKHMPALPEQDGLISRGCCDGCFVIEMEKIRIFFADETREKPATQGQANPGAQPS